MNQGEVLQRFKDLQWEAALPSPDDSPEIRQFKRENLLRALEVKRDLLNRSEVHAAQPRQLPSKRAQQLQELQNGEEAFRTPPTQRLPAIGPDSHHSKAPAAAGAGEDPTATTTGPKAAALTAQGLHMSGHNAGTNGSAPNWRRVNRQPDSSGAVPAPRQGTKREYQQTRLAAPSGGETRRAPSRLQATFTADGNNTRGALPREGNPGKSTWRAEDVRRSQVEPREQQQQQQNASRDEEIDDPIQDDDPIASPTQSPPFRLTLSRVLDDDDDSPNHQHRQHQHKHQKQQHRQQIEGREHQQQGQQPRQGAQRMALPLFIAETQVTGAGAGTGSGVGLGDTPERQMLQIDSTELNALDDQRTTLPRLRHGSLAAASSLRGGTFIMDTIPPTPAALFGLSETPGTNRPPPRLLGVPGTELANDASGRLVAGIFSPFSELAAELRAEEDAASGGGNLTFAAVPLFNNRPLAEDSPGNVLRAAIASPATVLRPQQLPRAPPLLPEKTPGDAASPSVLNQGALMSNPREQLERAPFFPIHPLAPPQAAPIPRGALCCPPAAPGEPASLRLRLPQPCLLAVSSTDGRHMALVLGSNADLEPTEIIVFSVSSSLVQGSSRNADADVVVETAAAAVAAGVRPIASVSVQRSRHAQGIPLSASSLAIVANCRGDPVLILSAVFELHDGPAPAGCPAIHAIPCSPGAPAAAVAAGAVAVEHDEPFFSVLPVGGKCTLLVAGETPGAAMLEFDSLWRCYTWGKKLPAALMEGGEGAEACVALVPVLDNTCCDHGEKTKYGQSTSSSSSRPRLVLGISLDGCMCLWDLEKRSCLLGARHNEFVVLEAVPLDTFESGFSGACLVRAQRRSDTVEASMLAICVLSNGNMKIVPVTAFSQVPTSLAMLTTKYPLVSTGNGVLEAWNMNTGTSCAVLTLDCGSALTSVTPLFSGGGGAGIINKPSVIVVTSSAGDCFVTSVEDLERTIEMKGRA